MERLERLLSKVCFVLIVFTLVVLALTILTSAATAYAEVPDVSKWSCPNAVVKSAPNYGMEAMNCNSGVTWNAYAKVSGELIYIHEHRMDADKASYYNAMKTNEGNWVEVVNKSDLVWKSKPTENRDAEVYIVDDNGIVVAKRTVPLLKK